MFDSITKTAVSVLLTWQEMIYQ